MGRTILVLPIFVLPFHLFCALRFGYPQANIENKKRCQNGFIISFSVKPAAATQDAQSEFCTPVNQHHKKPKGRPKQRPKISLFHKFSKKQSQIRTYPESQECLSIGHSTLSSIVKAKDKLLAELIHFLFVILAIASEFVRRNFNQIRALAILRSSIIHQILV